MWKSALRELRQFRRATSRQHSYRQATASNIAISDLAQPNLVSLPSAPRSLPIPTMNHYPEAWGRVTSPISMVIALILISEQPANNVYSPLDASYSQAMPKQHTQSPAVTGTSVLGVKFKDGVVIAADNLGTFSAPLARPSTNDDSQHRTAPSPGSQMSSVCGPSPRPRLSASAAMFQICNTLTACSHLSIFANTIPRRAIL